MMARGKSKMADGDPTSEVIDKAKELMGTDEPGPGPEIMSDTSITGFEVQFVGSLINNERRWITQPATGTATLFGSYDMALAEVQKLEEIYQHVRILKTVTTITTLLAYGEAT
jgi:hypothetical protein